MTPYAVGLADIDPASDLSDTPGEPLASEGADGAVPYPSTLSADPWVTAHPRSNTGGGGSLSSAAAVRRFPASSEAYETSVSEEYGGGFSRDGADEMPLDEGRVETVLVSYKDQLAGFLLKHKLWSITTSLSSEAITRRYADFPVLLAHFTARYPFRVLPALPPKRLLGGKYLGGVAVDDAAFLEERRRGLERFLRAALAHPVLRKDEFLRVFLTERAELSVLRSTSSISSTGEEGNLSPLSPAQLSSIPNDLEATLSQLRAALPKLITHWDKIVSALRQTLAKRESIALDYALLKGTCEGAVAAERSGWSDERGESGRGAERGIETLSWGDYLAKDAALINEGNTRCREGPLEGLLRVCPSSLSVPRADPNQHLALYKALHALFVRHAVLSSDAVEKLRTRTKNTSVKVCLYSSSVPLTHLIRFRQFAHPPHHPTRPRSSLRWLAPSRQTRLRFSPSSNVGSTSAMSFLSRSRGSLERRARR